MTEKQILKAIAALDAQKAPLQEELKEARRNKRIPCEKCWKRTRVRDLTYIQTHYYIHPYGCTGGDYWKQGEGQYDCPKCGHRNRLHEYNGRLWIADLKRYFGSVVETHDR